MNKSIKHLVIPDTQVRPGVPLDHLDWCGQYIAEKRPDVVVMLGDFADMSSLSRYDTGKRRFEGRRYKSDIKAARDGMERLLTPVRKVNKYKPRLVLTLGNHEDRITRATQDDAKLDGTIGLEDLRYEEAGWEVVPYLKPIEINGVTYCHYFPSGPKGLPCTSARSILSKYHQSCVAGHQQGRDIAYAKRPNGTQITCIIAGSFYLHDEDYLGPIINKQWRGIFMLHEVHKGGFDDMAISMGYLRKKYS